MLKVMTDEEVKKSKKETDEWFLQLPLDTKWAVKQFLERVLKTSTNRRGKNR